MNHLLSRKVSRSQPPTQNAKQTINIVLVVDVDRQSPTLKHRISVSECVQQVCKEMNANFTMVQAKDLVGGDMLAQDLFYNADAAIIEMSLDDQGNSLYYHLGVRESFLMKQNVLLVADISDNETKTNSNISTAAISSRHENSKAYNATKSENNRTSTQFMSHDDAMRIKSRLPNYSLFVYSLDYSSCDNQDNHKPNSVVKQIFADLMTNPGSEEQLECTSPDLNLCAIDFNQTIDQSALVNKKVRDTVVKTESLNPGLLEENSTQLLCLKTQIKIALKNVKWQAKAHMKDKFVAELKKARQTLQGEKLEEQLEIFRRRLDDPNMLSIEIVHQMLISYRETQNYNAMVKLVDSLLELPELDKITSAPEILYHHAFALNRRHNLGDSDRALGLIQNALKNKEQQNPDSICLCGRIFKDRFHESLYEDKESLKFAIYWYRQGFKIQPNEYAAINLATLLFINGHDFETSNELRHVGLVLNNLIGKKGPVQKLENYWDVATYFEFCVLANQYSNAMNAAECMFNLRPKKWHLKSTIGNIKLIYKFKTIRQSQQQVEAVQSAEEQIVEFWMDFFIDAVLDTIDNQIRFAVIVYENGINAPTYVTMNLDEEEKSVTISQMCIEHLNNNPDCKKPHTWHIKASDIRFTSLHKKDDTCIFLYVTSDDFQIFFPSEPLRAQFYVLIQSITGDDRAIDINANIHETQQVINYEYEHEPNSNSRIILGRGSLGVVYAALDMDTQTQIAIKEVPVKNANQIQPLHEEIRLHSMLRHRNIVQYLGSSDEGNYLCILMERVPGGSLSQLLQRKWGPLKETIIAFYSRQILDGLNYLHRQKIVHRDIKGDNVLVNTYNGIVKISDFGTCKRLAAINPHTETFTGTVPFMAPEVLDGGQRGYSMPADVWSFGCTVVEMATGKPPFIEIECGAQVIFKVGFHKEHPEIPEHLSDKCRAFIMRCFDPNPENRATCKELLRDPFLQIARPSSSTATSKTSPSKAKISLQNSSSPQTESPMTVTPSTPLSPPSLPKALVSLQKKHCLQELKTKDGIDVEEKHDNLKQWIASSSEAQTTSSSIDDQDYSASMPCEISDKILENDNKSKKTFDISEKSTLTVNKAKSQSNSSCETETTCLTIDRSMDKTSAEQSKSLDFKQKHQTSSSNKYGLNLIKLDKEKLLQLNEELASENRDLLSQLYQKQFELQLALKMQLNDKKALLDCIRGSQNASI